MSKKINIIFDNFIPDVSGGLVTTYERLVTMLNNQYDFEIISIFNCGVKQTKSFGNTKIVSLLSRKNTPSSAKLLRNLREFHFLNFCRELVSFFLYFIYIPVGREKLKSLIDERDINIVVSPSSAIFMPKNMKFILEIHSSYDYFFGEKASIIGRLQGKLMKEPSLVLFRTKSDAIKGKSKFNSYYIYNFFDNSTLKPLSLDNFNERKNKILYIGRLAPEKNLTKMLKCAKILKEKYGEFRLDIYGTGPMEEVLKKQIEEWKLKDNVFLQGFCRDKNIYKNYSLLWITSDFEGLCLVIIEAKANAVPTISTNWGDGVYEEINDTQDGFICDNIDDIVDKTIYLLDNENKLTEMSIRALDDFHRFSKKEAYSNWLYILKKYENNDMFFNLK